MPTDRQISQLVLQVDANIAVAQRELQNLARVVNQTSGQMNSSLGSTAAAHTKLSGAFNQSRLAQMELSHVMTASVDAYAAGASPLRILTLEMGRVAQAASFMGGGTGALGKFAGFMGGPWGIAVLLGVNVLAQLISKIGAGSDTVADLVQKMRQQAQQAQANVQAEKIWQSSIEGTIDRNEKLIDTLQKRLKAEEDIDAQALRGAQSDKAKADKELHDAQTRLNNLLQQQAVTERANATGGAGIRAESLAPVGAGNVLSSQIAAARQALQLAQKDVAVATASINQNLVAVGEDTGKALSSSSNAIDAWSKRYVERLHAVEIAAPASTAAIAGAFDRLKDALGDAAGAKVPFSQTGAAANNLINELKNGKIGPEQYAAAMDKLTTSLLGFVEAAKNAKKGTGELGKEISFADAESIAKSAGLTVTSGYRSVAKQAALYNDPSVNKPGNPVARPGASAHNGLNGKWALDIAFAPGITPASLKKLYGDQGVSLSAVYKESGHYHIEGSTSQATAAQKAADRAAQKQKTDDDQFTRESAQLDAQTLQARKQLVAGYDTQADIASDEVEAQRRATLAAIKKQKDAGQINDGQAKELSLQADNLAAAQQAVIAHKKYTDGLNQLAASAKQQADAEIEDLQFANDMAKTQAEHRSIQLQILDVQYQQKEADLNRLLLSIQLNKDFATSVDLQRQANDVQAQINRLPVERSQDQTRVQQGTLSPLDQWRKSIPQTADQMNEAMQNLEVQGLDGLATALSHVGEGWKAMRDIALQTIQQILAALIKMQIEKALLNIIGQAAGGLGGQGFLATGADASFGASGVLGAGTAASMPLVPGFATGGFMSIGGNGGTDRNVLSINGIPRAKVSSDERLAIIPNASRIAFPTAANSNSPSGDTYHINVSAPNTGNPRRDRSTALQQAAMIRESVTMAGRKGVA